MFLHSKGICHRDIKLENVMLETDSQGNCQIKLTDFGFATFFTTDVTTVAFCVGTPEYMAPEILTKGETHNEKVDIWALSVLSYLLLA